MHIKPQDFVNSHERTDPLDHVHRAFIGLLVQGLRAPVRHPNPASQIA